MSGKEGHALAGHLAVSITVQRTGSKDWRLCAEDTRSCFQSKVHNSYLRRHEFLLLSNEGNQTHDPACKYPTGPRAAPVNHHVVQIQQKSLNLLPPGGTQTRSLQQPGLAAFLCPEWISPSPGRLGPRRLSCPPSADEPARYEHLLAGQGAWDRPPTALGWMPSQR